MASTIDILKAKKEIRDLITRYSHFLDYGRGDEWVGCFREDGVFDSPFFGRHPGKDALKKMVESYHKSIGPVQHRHCVMNTKLVVDVDAGSATAESYWLYIQAKEGKTNLLRLGRYIDKIEKVNGKWLFKERKAPLD